MLQAKCFVDPLSAPFSRRGSDMAFANANNGDSQFGKNTLYLMSCRGGGSGLCRGAGRRCGQDDRFKLDRGARTNILGGLRGIGSRICHGCFLHRWFKNYIFIKGNISRYRGKTSCFSHFCGKKQ